jgi:3'-5' exoribonuclease
MSDPKIKQLEEIIEGDFIKGKFAVRTKETPREYKNKSGKYFFLSVGDKTGQISLKYWGGPEDRALMELYNSISVGDVIEVTGEVAMDKYENVLTLSLDEGAHIIRVCEKEEYKPEDFLPVSERNIDDMMEELHSIIGSIREENYREILEEFFGDSEFTEAFKKAPAAMKHHHSYIGGLLEHTLNVVKMCDLLSQNYLAINRDLLLTATMLHDIGKIEAYEANTSIDMSDSGKFLGHITIGASMLDKKLDALISFPPVIKMKLKHLIISHHGNTESGFDRPKSLKIPEAAALFYADLYDAKVKEFLQEVEREKNVEDDWVYIRGLGNEIYLK